MEEKWIEVVSMRCPYKDCGSKNVKLAEDHEAVYQVWYCKDCRRQFTFNKEDKRWDLKLKVLGKIMMMN